MSDDRYDNNRYYNEDTFSVQATAGAVPIRNDKGEITMKKVKVTRYVSGKRPEFAREESSEEESSDEDDFTQNQKRAYQRRDEEPDSPQDVPFHDEDEPTPMDTESDLSDPRIRRLMQAKMSQQDEESDEDERANRRRRIHQPEVLSDDEDESNEPRRPGRSDDSDESSADEEVDEEAIQRRRELMRQRALAKAQIGLDQEEIMDKEEEKSGSEEDEEETTEEESTDSEDEDKGRPKPVFVRKRDRLTVQEREKEEAKEEQISREKQMMADIRRKDTRRLIETIVKENVIESKMKDSDPKGLNEVNTDDENDAEADYEAWKLRELKRLKRDRDELETREKEKAEIERMRNLTEEERRMEARNKVVTNKAAKGKYKFMQKYYHRGVFYMDEENDLLKRDFTAPTLEDRFDKTVLPKVMQVKNFGRSGRTKYTHLVDQDTTQFDSPWASEATSSLKYQLQHAGGFKQTFEAPSVARKKRKTSTSDQK